MLLGLFAKYWRPGEVKTRLAQAVGAEAAAQFHRLCVETTVARLVEVQADRVLVYSPAEMQAAFASMGARGWRLVPQVCGDLGARLERFFRWAFTCGAARVAVVGADSPTLPVEYVQRAFVQLEKHPVVLGPAADGGYYLLAARPPVPPIFDRIEWGSPRVWTQTLRRLEAAGIAPAILPDWYDVDEPDDLVRLADELACSAPPHCRELALLAAELAGPLRGKVIRRSCEMPR